MTKTEKWKRA